MQARCPHCQNIFPTTRGGLQYCPSCGKQINVPLPPGMGPDASASGDPAGPVTGSTPAWGNAPGGAPGPLPPGEPMGAAAWQPTPWELRKTPAAFFETWKGAMGSDRFWSQVRPQGSLWDALSFAWIIAVVSALLSWPFAMLRRSSMDPEEMERALEEVPQEYRELAERLIETFTHLTPLYLVLAALIFTPILLVMTSALFHLALMVVGAATQGFTATLRAVCYGYAPMLFSFIPLVEIFTWLYWMVLSVWGATRLQQTTPSRSIGALAISVLFSCCCLLPLVAAVIAMVMAAAAGVAGAGAP